ncbi:hypothetical protein DMH17_03865 [Raoultella planticola]|nr:hypothetical protein [Raoultella planticola]
MDYLLLSYVLYHQGLVPPHIAAGINLNFWASRPHFPPRWRTLFVVPLRAISSIQRCSANISASCSAGVTPWSTSLKGRSRTGRLLDPKTGTLSMTISHAARRDPTDHAGAYLHRLRARDGSGHLRQSCAVRRKKRESAADAARPEQAVTSVRAMLTLANLCR